MSSEDFGVKLDNLVFFLSQCPRWFLESFKLGEHWSKGTKLESYRVVGSWGPSLPLISRHRFWGTGNTWALVRSSRVLRRSRLKNLALQTPGEVLGVFSTWLHFLSEYHPHGRICSVFSWRTEEDEQSHSSTLRELSFPVISTGSSGQRSGPEGAVPARAVHMALSQPCVPTRRERWPCSVLSTPSCQGFPRLSPCPHRGYQSDLDYESGGQKL